MGDRLHNGGRAPCDGCEGRYGCMEALYEFGEEVPSHHI